MRNRSILVLCVVVVLLVSSVAASAEAISVQRVEESGRLLVPLRGIFEFFGATVEWDGARKAVEIDRGGDHITMFVNEHNAYVNDQTVYLDVSPRVFRSRTHVPLRFVGEALGGTVDYYGSYVDISVPGQNVLRVNLTRSSAGSSSGRSGGSYIASWTNTRSVTDAALAGYTNWQLTLMRNEIYARHGRTFNNKYVRNHFLSQSWYSANSNYRDSWLSSLERENAEYIRDYQTAVFIVNGPATHP